MAVTVGFFENNDTIEYKDGPFVICNPLNNGWRIEVEGEKFPVLLDSSIYHLIDREFGHVGKWESKKEAERICDWLNEQVIEENIIKVGKTWIA